MYRVIEPFTDLKDGNHLYNVGDEYPRSGADTDSARIFELSTDANLLGVALIEEVQETAEKPDSVVGNQKPRGRKPKTTK